MWWRWWCSAPVKPRAGTCGWDATVEASCDLFTRSVISSLETKSRSHEMNISSDGNKIQESSEITGQESVRNQPILYMFRCVEAGCCCDARSLVSIPIVLQIYREKQMFIICKYFNSKISFYCIYDAVLILCVCDLKGFPVLSEIQYRGRGEGCSVSLHKQDIWVWLFFPHLSKNKTAKKPGVAFGCVSRRLMGCLALEEASFQEALAALKRGLAAVDVIWEEGV